jgi:hypothetical protein
MEIVSEPADFSPAMAAWPVIATAAADWQC